MNNRMRLFGNISARHELGRAFGQLDIYQLEVRGTDRDSPEIRAEVMHRCDEAIRNAPSSWALKGVHEHLADSDDPRSSMETTEYVHAWEKLQLELGEEEIEDQLDATDPLHRADVESAYATLEPAYDEFAQRWPLSVEARARARRAPEWVADGSEQSGPQSGIDRDQLGDPLTAETREIAVDELVHAIGWPWACELQPGQTIYNSAYELGVDERGVLDVVRVEPLRGDSDAVLIHCADGPPVRMSGSWPMELYTREDADLEKSLLLDEQERHLNRSAEPPAVASTVSELGIGDTELVIESDLDSSAAGPELEAEPELAVADVELIAAARDWISECTWADLDPDDIAELSNEEIIGGIEQNYDGGLAAFGESVWLDGVDVLEAELVDESAEAPVDTPVAAPQVSIDDAELVDEPDSIPTATAEPITQSPDPELDIAELGLTDPELAEQELTDDTEQVVGNPVALEGTEPKLGVDAPQLGDQDAQHELELNDTTGDEVTAEPEQLALTPEPELEMLGEQPASWWRSAYDATREVAADKYQLTKAWIKELRSGRHRQCHGSWQETGPLGGVKECTIQVAKNTFNMDLEDVREKYGIGFVNEVLNRNDKQRQSFDQIADFIDRTQLRDQDRTPERDR